MKLHGYAENRDRLLKRVNRLEGVIRGIGKMIEDDRHCIDIVDQLNAVQSAARELSLVLLEDHVRHCVADAARADNAEPMVRELTLTLGRAMGR